MESSPSDTAEVLGGRYRLGTVIGRGGTASVYTARDENLGRDVALKLFAPQSADADELKRQEAEIELLATLSHPSLVTLFDAGIDSRVPEEPRPFLTMELLDGQDLRSRIRHSPVPLDELAVIGAGIADALAYVHNLGIIHRDIKPANILLVRVRPGEPLRPKLTDFGIARIVDGTRLTATGTMVGTAAYLSPEQARGTDLGPASDIYSLGLVLLECIKGSVEYPGSAIESAVARLHRAPQIPADLPAEWAKLISSMTAIDPMDRPTAAELETVLRHALVSPESVPAVMAEEPTRVLPAPPSRPPLLTPENIQVPENIQASGQHTVVSTGNLAEAEDTPAPTLLRQPPRPPGRKRGSRGGSNDRRGKLAAAAATAIALLVAALALLSVTQPATSDPVPYPAVTGTLGEHLNQLQRSVEP
ncbi:serine/threonine-protein kinase [Arthrobacter sp. ISL-72]|uniref:serine/threonine-protein kinase n=1 Tax=Arthrobacter sp. ISL-72 TaxID=2819114 RepID=UPI001BE4FD2C|nr:serine/threonine-protein kinase [Arthrobacter sp. ISL-72]MBT2595644.1 protein kinase [Arthrobacter sp. ISL-72]